MEKSAKLWINSRDVIKSFQKFQEAFSDFQIAYAIKSNSDSRIIELLMSKYSSFEISSYQEIKYLLELSVSPEKIIFSNPIKDPDAIEFAIQNGVSIFSFDSEEELDKFMEYKDRAILLFRIGVPNDGAFWPLSKKFGCPRRFWRNIFKKMQDNKIPLGGITFHVGSQCELLETWGIAMQNTYEAISISHEYQLTPHILNIGGGFPIDMGRKIPDIKEIAEEIQKNINIWKQKGIEIDHFIAEPGRYIVGPAGTLATTVIGIANREDSKWVYLNSGVFNGMLETVEGIHYLVTSNGSGPMEEVMLCGPSCDAFDKLYKVKIPSPKIGDTIYFHSTGAYTSVYSSRFNGFDGPEVILSDSSITGKILV